MMSTFVVCLFVYGDICVILGISVTTSLYLFFIFISKETNTQSQKKKQFLYFSVASIRHLSGIHKLTRGNKMNKVLVIYIEGSLFSIELRLLTFPYDTGSLQIVSSVTVRYNIMLMTYGFFNLGNYTHLIQSVTFFRSFIICALTNKFLTK